MHQTVRCCKRTKDFNGQQLQTPTHHRTMNSVVSGAPPDRPVCPSTAKLANGYEVVGGYKYSPTTSIQAIQAFQLSLSILKQKHTLQDTIKRSNPLQASKSTQVLSDLREGALCFFCCSCCFNCFLLLILNFSSVL
jgi:hypothetical protein